MVLIPSHNKDFYEIYSKLFKDLADIIAETLNFLLNISLVSGIFPEILKATKVIPIFKKEINPFLLAIAGLFYK